MKKPLCTVLEFNSIQYFSKKEIKTLLLFFSLLVLLLSPATLFSQEIPSTGTTLNACGSCTPQGWEAGRPGIPGGTPDISTTTLTGGFDTAGGAATWIGTPELPGELPPTPTQQTSWITIRDVGPDFTEENVTTKITGLILNEFYVVTLYTMTALSAQNGGGNGEANGTAYYSGTYLETFDYQLEYIPIGANVPTRFPRQSIFDITKEVWGVKKYYFKAPATEIQVTFFPNQTAD
jgi:hypothetical protein